MRTWSALPLLIAASICQGLRAQDKTPTSRDTTVGAVASLEAYLYHQGTGTTDTVNLIGALPKAGFLWNTSIGEGMAHTPSGALFVRVGLRGNFVYDSTGVVELKAEVSGQTLLQRSVRLRSLFSETGWMYVPFVVYGTGCGDLVLTATVSHRTKVDGTLSKTIPFKCGE